jgi:hypothetical protein
VGGATVHLSHQQLGAVEQELLGLLPDNGSSHVGQSRRSRGVDPVAASSSLLPPLR